MKADPASSADCTPQTISLNPKRRLQRMTAKACAPDPGPAKVLDVVIEKELVRMRAQTNFVDLARPFVAEIRIDHVLRENISLRKELVIFLKRIERFIERSGRFRHSGHLLRRQVV